jgi:hypothetical protein
MSDYKTILDRAGRSLPNSRNGLNEILRRRDRKHRTRKITAGVVALLVAAAGTVSAFTAFGPGDDRPAGVDAEHFFALWPEDDLESALEAQDRVDGGVDEWRTDAKRTAAEFAYRVMRTPRDALELEDLSDTSICLLSDPPICPEDAARVVVPRLGGIALTVHLQRLVRLGEGGVWNVVKIDGRMEFPGLEPGAHLQPGQEVFVQGRPEGPTAAVRYCANTRDTKVRPENGRTRLGYTFRVPAVAVSGCRGFVMVATGIGDDIAPMARTMFDPIGVPGLCQTAVTNNLCDPGAATALAVIPVTFDYPDPAPSPPAEGPSAKCRPAPCWGAYLEAGLDGHPEPAFGTLTRAGYRVGVDFAVRRLRCDVGAEREDVPGSYVAVVAYFQSKAEARNFADGSLGILGWVARVSRQTC